MGTDVRSIRILAGARLISVLGSSASFTALTIAVFQTTGSPVWVSITMVATYGLRGVANLWAGGIADRFDRRAVMIACDLVAAAVYAAMAVLDGPAVLIALAAVAAIVAAPFEAAAAAAIPSLATPDRLSWANGLIGAGRSIGFSIGPVLGGAVAAVVGPGPVFAADAVTFLLSAAAISRLRIPAVDGPADDRADSTSWAGLRWILADRVLRTVSLADAVLVLGVGVVLVADLPLAIALGAGGVGYGILYAAWGVGTVLGSLLGRRMDERSEPAWLLGGAIILALEAFVVAISPWFALTAALILVGGFGDALWIVAALGIRQRRAPDGLRARVLSTSDSVVWLSLIPGLVLAGPLIEAIGPRWTYVLFGVLAVIAALILVPVWRWSRGSRRRSLSP